MSSPLRVIRGHIPSGTPNSLAQACSAQSRARVFSSLTVWKSFWLETSAGGRKCARWNLLNVGGAPYYSKALHWTRGSLNAATGQWAHWRASALLRPSLIRWVPVDNLPLGLAPSISGGDQSFPFPHGSTYGDG